MNGIGIYKWADGKVFEGEFKRDVKNGFGRFKWPDGRLYQGGWENGKQEGLGSYTYFNDSKKEITKFGLWKNGDRISWFDTDTKTSIDQQLRNIEDI